MADHLPIPDNIPVFDTSIEVGELSQRMVCAPGGLEPEHGDALVRVSDLPDLHRLWAAELRGKLEELRLHDATGDPRDDGYMACLSDVLAAVGLEDRP